MKGMLHLALLAIAACGHTGLPRDELPNACAVIRNPSEFDGQVVKLKLWVKPGVPSFYHSDCLENFLVPIPPYENIGGEYDQFDELVAMNVWKDEVGVEAEIVARVVWPKDAKAMTDHGLQFLEIRNPRLIQVPGSLEMPKTSKKRE